MGAREATWQAWQVKLGALVWRQELCPREQSEARTAWAAQLAHRPWSQMEGGSCGHAAPCLKAGSQSDSPDVSLKNHDANGGRMGILVGRKETPQKGISCFWASLSRSTQDPAHPPLCSAPRPLWGFIPCQSFWAETRATQVFALGRHKDKVFPGRTDCPPELQLKKSGIMPLSVVLFLVLSK